VQIDVSFLPALGAAFLLIFARTGTMIMLLPGIGEQGISPRMRLTVALVLAAVLVPLHRADYHLVANTLGPAIVMVVEEIIIGAVLGLSARLTISALDVAGSLIAQALGLGFVTAVDPSQGEQGAIISNFLTMLAITLFFATDMHHLVLAALNDSYTLFAPGEVPATGDVAALVTKSVSGAFRVGVQLSAPFLVFGLMFNIGLGVLSRLMPAMQVYFLAMPLSILGGFLFLVVVLGAMMGMFLDYTAGVLHDIAPHA
jgi:flagellar biosynthesis protein FliR